MAKGIILLVDDSPLVLSMTRDFLEGGGYEVVTCDSWVEVNPIIRNQRPDLILLDLMMPGIAGEQICETLKKYEHSREIPVILYSTKPEEELKQAQVQAGADGYIPKRLAPQELVAEVDDYFRKLCS